MNFFLSAVRFKGRQWGGISNSPLFASTECVAAE